MLSLELKIFDNAKSVNSLKFPTSKFAKISFKIVAVKMESKSFFSQIPSIISVATYWNSFFNIFLMYKNVIYSLILTLQVHSDRVKISIFYYITS